MASVLLPSNPQLDATTVVGNKTLKWDGRVWVSLQAASGGAEEAVAEHSDVTTSVHGIADTALLATKAYADNAAASVVDAAPATLNTLNELAAALGDDANYAATVTTALGAKQDKVNGVSDTEIGYLDGVTSSVQGQVDAKIDKSVLLAKGDLVAATASGTPSRIGIGADGQVLTANSLQASGVSWSSPAAPTLKALDVPEVTKFVAIPANSNIAATSPDGITWTQRTLPATANWRSQIAYGNGTFVAIAASSNIAATSPDGITWTQRTLPDNQFWHSIGYGNGLFVALADSSNIAATSPDGITWTQRTLPSSYSWQSVAFGNGTFVSLAYDSSIAITSSANLTTWTQRTLPTAANWKAITYGNGLFVAIAWRSTIAATSPDGITWTQRTLPDADWNGVAYGDGKFVAVGNSNIAATSPDGITWTQRTLPSYLNLWSVSYLDGLFVAVTYNSNKLLSSPDGITWTQRTLPATAFWRNLTSSSKVFSAKTISGELPEVITNTSYVVGPYDKWLNLATVGICTVTLPNPALNQNREIVIKQTSANAVNSSLSNVKPFTSQTPGVAILTTSGKYAKLVSNGTHWVIMEAN